MTQDESAFPCTKECQATETKEWYPRDYPGLTKREYFAAKALGGILSRPTAASRDARDIALEVWRVTDMTLAMGPELAKEAK